MQKKVDHYSDEYKQLKDLIKGKFSGYSYNQKLLNRNHGIPYVNIKDLSDEKKAFYLNPDKVDTFVKENAYRENVKQKTISKMPFS